MAGAVNEYIFGLDIFVDQTTLVGMAERRCQVNGKAQEMRQIERCSRSAPECGLEAHRQDRRERGLSVLRDA